MIFWSLIGFAAVTAFFFRVVPFVFKDSAALNDTDGFLYRVLIYSTQAMMGVIIYDIAFAKADALTLIERFQATDAVKLGVLVMTFVAVTKTNKMLPAFFASFFVYVVVVVCQNGGF